MLILKLILLFIGVLLFLAGVIGYIYVRFKYKPMIAKELEDYYYEFEDQHPGLQKYDKLSSLAMITTTVGVLLLFVVIAI